MTRKQQRTDRAMSNITRRQALVSGGVLIAAGGTMVVTAEPASAAIEVEQLSIPDESFTRETLTPQLDVTAGYTYDAANEPVDKLRFTLSVDGSEIASEELITDRTTLENETTLSGLVTDSEAWSQSDFAPEVASTVEQTLSVTLSFAVLDSAGDVIVSDEATDEAVVSVSHPQESQLTASVGGTGSISATDN